MAINVGLLHIPMCPHPVMYFLWMVEHTSTSDFLNNSMRRFACHRLRQAYNNMWQAKWCMEVLGSDIAGVVNQPK